MQRSSRNPFHTRAQARCFLFWTSLHTDALRRRSAPALGLRDLREAPAKDGKSFVGSKNKDDIIKTLVEKLKIDDGVANKIYEAVAGALASGIVDNVANKIKDAFKQ